MKKCIPKPLSLQEAESRPGYFLPMGADSPTACCFSYVARESQRKFIEDYLETSSQCSQPGVIFLTKRGRQVCADPNENWVQEYVTDLELNA
uniref:C-C motif chemokine 3-like n=1 Tax=Marmota marmota marmota TaxID=9994 RepID=A0A8C6EWR8_MARMA